MIKVLSLGNISLEEAPEKLELDGCLVQEKSEPEREFRSNDLAPQGTLTKFGEL